jgi:hypothetical protein
MLSQETRRAAMEDNWIRVRRERLLFVLIAHWRAVHTHDFAQ